MLTFLDDTSQKGQHPKICWVFRANACLPDRYLDDDLDLDANMLYGDLIDHCKCFQFQLEAAPETGE